VALVRIEVTEECIASIIRVKIMGELGTALAVNSVVPSSSILSTVMMEAISSSETSVLTRATQREIPEDCSLQLFRYYYSATFNLHILKRLERPVGLSEDAKVN
jgi:phospholipid N-methyltransferase